MTWLLPTSLAFSLSLGSLLNLYLPMPDYLDLLIHRFVHTAPSAWKIDPQLITSAKTLIPNKVTFWGSGQTSVLGGCYSSHYSYHDWNWLETLNFSPQGTSFSQGSHCHSHTLVFLHVYLKNTPSFEMCLLDISSSPLPHLLKDTEISRVDLKHQWQN